MQAARIGFCLGSHFGRGQYQNGMINSGLSSEDHAETNLQNILQTGFTPSQSLIIFHGDVPFFPLEL